MIAGSHEHYLLTCIDCDFSHHVPSNYTEGVREFSVDPHAGKIQCIYGPPGGSTRFTVTLDVNDFFSFAVVPESGQELHVDIGPNMKMLHPHMLSHCDPLFLMIEQSATRTDHTYKRAQEGANFVKFSAQQGVDIVGNINIAKAEIPGVSD